MAEKNDEFTENKDELSENKDELSENKDELSENKNELSENKNELSENDDDTKKIFSFIANKLMTFYKKEAAEKAKLHSIQKVEAWLDTL